MLNSLLPLNELNTSGIYSIINLVNGRIYIGSASNLKQRRFKHLSLLSRNIHDNRFLQNSWNKHGGDNFEFKVLEFCIKDLLLWREQHYIDSYFSVEPNGFNITPTAGSNIGLKLSEETKALISQRNRERGKASVETKAKMSATRKGRIQTPEWIARRHAAAQLTKAKKRQKELTMLNVDVIGSF